MKQILSGAVCGVALVIATSATATVVDTFDNGVNLGTWRLTSNPERLYKIEPDGGDPGAWLHGQVSTAVPTWYIDDPIDNPFVGDFAAERVRSFSFDLTISGGIQVPDRLLTLHLYTTLGTGDPSLGIEAYYVGDDVSYTDPGWNAYSYPLDAASMTIPDGWVVLNGDGSPGSDTDWQDLVRDIENVTIDLGQPGYAYPNLGIWDLGLDNVTLHTAPVVILHGPARADVPSGASPAPH